MTTPTKELLRPDEVAKMLKVSKQTLYRYLQLGYIKAIKRKPNRIWIPMESVIEYLKGEEL